MNRPRKRAQITPRVIASGTAITAVIEASVIVLRSRGPSTAMTGRPAKDWPRSPVAAAPSHER